MLFKACVDPFERTQNLGKTGSEELDETTYAYNIITIIIYIGSQNHRQFLL
jgi:hypothetical protein